MSRSEASEANTTPAEEIQCSCGDVHWGGSNVVVVSNINSLPLFFFLTLHHKSLQGLLHFLCLYWKFKGLKDSNFLHC